MLCKDIALSRKSEFRERESETIVGPISVIPISKRSNVNYRIFSNRFLDCHWGRNVLLVETNFRHVNLIIMKTVFRIGFHWINKQKSKQKKKKIWELTWWLFYLPLAKFMLNEYKRDFFIPIESNYYILAKPRKVTR